MQYIYTYAYIYKITTNLCKSIYMYIIHKYMQVCVNQYFLFFFIYTNNSINKFIVLSFSHFALIMFALLFYYSQSHIVIKFFCVSLTHCN